MATGTFQVGSMWITAWTRGMSRLFPRRGGRCFQRIPANKGTRDAPLSVVLRSLDLGLGAGCTLGSTLGRPCPNLLMTWAYRSSSEWFRTVQNGSGNGSGANFGMPLAPQLKAFWSPFQPFVDAKAMSAGSAKEAKEDDRGQDFGLAHRLGNLPRLASPVMGCGGSGEWIYEILFVVCRSARWWICFPEAWWFCGASLQHQGDSKAWHRKPKATCN